MRLEEFYDDEGATVSQFYPIPTFWLEWNRDDEGLHLDVCAAWLWWVGVTYFLFE